MTVEELMKSKNDDNIVFDVRIGGRYGQCVGQIIRPQAREAAEFVREKYGSEPEFYYESHFGWLRDLDGNIYEITPD